MFQNKAKFCLTAIAFALSIPTFAQVSQSEQKAISDYLQRFQRDPQKSMDEVPVKTAVAPFALKSVPKFSPQSIQSGSFVEEKDAMRFNLLNGAKRPGARAAAAVRGNDNPASLVDAGASLIGNVVEMDNRRLGSARLTEQPWSDTYWPLYNGSVSYRYGDPDVYSNNPSTWKDYWTYSNTLRPVSGYLSSLKTELLSPAEKYDLLVNDGSFSLTRAGWKMGEGYYNNSGSVEGWMGLCHGWAPAAYMLPRPKKTITVTSPAGQSVKFYPSDVKALGTMLWAEAAPSTRFIGGRCNAKDPAKDQNGRIIDEACFDTNPGSWHQAVVNQIGVAKRSFVIDATFDYEVWNQPVLAYSYTYFNPQTGQAYNTAKEAMIARANYTSDKFSKYRGNSAVNIVGVKMNLSYIVETSPTHNDTDGPRNDAITNVAYMYDLELDSRGNIIGGEWYTNRHPDFLWTPAPTQRAVSYYNPTDLWDTRNPLPAHWTGSAVNASRYSQPLTAVVEQLFKLSSGQ
ncbi:peptidase [Chitinimonas sp. BJB300]|uniref:peptidase n=1 Tax=Chitinimonas sp. BJB300 TaxID=1559339 RepID=UPI000C0F36C0|nr:peptidase [Chitinimonas sp. BJB300]PHV10282.1 peptidase [Chitinimonas sp. BJB300]TSJ84787.1 peptidase [Chitinimonas sp. BJB300]